VFLRTTWEQLIRYNLVVRFKSRTYNKTIFDARTVVQCSNRMCVYSYWFLKTISVFIVTVERATKRTEIRNQNGKLTNGYYNRSQRTFVRTIFVVWIDTSFRLESPKVLTTITHLGRGVCTGTFGCPGILNDIARCVFEFRPADVPIYTPLLRYILKFRKRCRILFCREKCPRKETRRTNLYTFFSVQTILRSVHTSNMCVCVCIVIIEVWHNFLRVDNIRAPCTRKRGFPRF